MCTFPNVAGWCSFQCLIQGEDRNRGAVQGTFHPIRWLKLLQQEVFVSLVCTIDYDREGYASAEYLILTELLHWDSLLVDKPPSKPILVRSTASVPNQARCQVRKLDAPTTTVPLVLHVFPAQTANHPDLILLIILCSY